MNNVRDEQTPVTEVIRVGWREWVALPELGLHRLKAKVDTGARTSALHAFSLEEYRDGDVDMVRFCIHPEQRNEDLVVECQARVADRRVVTDSGGHSEERVVIESMLDIAGTCWPIELTLTCRDNMKFRMLLGRTAMRGRITVDPGASYLLGRPPRQQPASQPRAGQEAK